MNIKFDELQLHHWLVVIGGGVAVLAVLFYFVGAKFRLPAAIASGLGGLVAGGGIGMVSMIYLGYAPKEDKTNVTPTQPADGGGGGMMGAMAGGGGGMMGMGGDKAGKGGGGMMGMGGGKAGKGGGGMMGMGGGKAGKGGGGFGGGGFGRGPSSKAQLLNLVVKLDTLTEKPLTVQLSDEQRKQISEVLKSLNDADQVSDEDAKKILDSMLKVLEKEKDVLKAAGYTWPGETPQRPQGDPPNPFKMGPESTHFKSLQDRLMKK